MTLEIEHDKMLYRNGYPVLSKDLVDSVLFESLPLLEIGSLESAIREIVSGLPGLEERGAFVEKGINELLSAAGNELFITSKQLQSMIKAMLCDCIEGTSSPYNYPLLIANLAREKGYAMPIALRCADTNWVSDYFAFVVNPGTGALDFWRVNCTATQGFRMSIWDVWLNGSRKDRAWGFYTKPHEYRLT